MSTTATKHRDPTVLAQLFRPGASLLVVGLGAFALVAVFAGPRVRDVVGGNGDGDKAAAAAAKTDGTGTGAAGSDGAGDDAGAASGGAAKPVKDTRSPDEKAADGNAVETAT